MEQKKEKKKGEGSHFMEKFFTRLKMTKGKSETIVKDNSIESKPFFILDYPKINADNMMTFSNQLQELLEYVQEAKEVIFYTYDYPSILNSKLEKEATELKNLFRDVRAAAIDIDRLKKQRQAVKKERNFMTKKLDNLKEDEIRELESVIHTYARPLYSKWESIKNTQKPEVLENFMNEVSSKQRAMEILEELIAQRLTKISKKSFNSPFSVKKNTSATATSSKIKNMDRTNWSTNPFTTDSPKPLKSIPDRDIVKTRRTKRQKEIREERKRPGSETPGISGLDLQLVPLGNIQNDEFDSGVFSRNAQNNKTPAVTNVEYISDEDNVSLSSSDYVIENFMQSVNNPENQPDLQNEMRNVLQALFGEIRHIPQLTNNTRNRHNNSGNDLRSPRNASH